MELKPLSEAEVLLDYYRKQVQIMRDKFPDWHNERYYDTPFHGQYYFYRQDYFKDIEKWLTDYDHVFHTSKPKANSEEERCK